MERPLIVLASLAVVMACGSSLMAQQPAPSPSPSNEKSECQIPIYKGRDADRKARILAKPDPKYTNKERRDYKGSVITLRATLCGSGQVTDIKVKFGLTPALDEKAIAAAGEIKFAPGEKDGQPISTLITILYRVN